MSKVINNPLLKGVSGQLGNTVYYRSRNDKPQMCNMPGPRKRSTTAQKKQNMRFKDATQYAKRQVADPGSKALYQKGVNADKSSAYLVALSDYLNAPVIHYIQPKLYTGLVGSLITIKVTDDFRVEEVHVEIHTPNRKLLESGNAERNKRKPFMWNYRATVVNPSPEGSVIKVVARDRPGNRVKGDVVVGRGSVISDR